MAELAVGQVVDGRYEIEALIGRGGMGSVYRARHVITNGRVALKTLHRSDAEHQYELKREFRRLAGLSHTNLVQLYELFAAQGECFFTMELLEGRDLVSELRGTRPAGRGKRSGEAECTPSQAVVVIPAPFADPPGRRRPSPSFCEPMVHCKMGSRKRTGRNARAL